MEEIRKKTIFGDEVIIRLQKSSTDDPQRTGTDPPTALLFGWVGSSHKNVSKYAAIFNQMGYNTAQVIAPFSAIFSLYPDRTFRYFLSVMRIIAADERLTKGGLVIKLFSNGGAFFALHLSTMFNGTCPDVKPSDQAVIQVFKKSIAAVIFDSAPCYLSVHIGSLAICEGAGIKGALPRLMISAVFALYVLIQVIFVIHLPSYFWNGLRKADYGCPEMYLYSTIDQLLDADKLDALIEERKGNKKEVHVFRVEDADHVLLLRKHREKYVQHIRSVNQWGVNELRERIGLSPWVLPEARSSSQSD